MDYTSRQLVSKAIAIPKPSRLPARLRKKLESAFVGWLDKLEPHTQTQYYKGLVYFATWLDKEGAVELEETPPLRSPERKAWNDVAVTSAGQYLVGLKEPDAILLTEAYLHDSLYGSGKVFARATVTARLAALRWATREARRFGHTSWDLSLAKMPSPRKSAQGKLLGKRGRDMTGPTTEQARGLLSAAAEDPDPRASLLLHFMRYEGYREHEIRQMDLEDLDLRKGTVMIVRKKRSEAKAYPLSTKTREVLREWLKLRGRKKGPVFYGGVHGGRIGSRIAARTIRGIVTRVSKVVGYWPSSPHRIRHRACTDIVQSATAQGLPEEELLHLTGHTSRASLQPYYEARGHTKPRAVLDGIDGLEA